MTRRSVGVAEAFTLLMVFLLPAAFLVSSINWGESHGAAFSPRGDDATPKVLTQDYWLSPWGVASPTKALPGMNVTFDASGSYGSYPIVSYRWNFTEGKRDVVLLGMTVVYAFTEVGNYLVTLWVQDSQGHQAGMVVDVEIVNEIDNHPPVAVAQAYGEPFWVNVSVYFYGGASSDDTGIISWEWTISGGHDAPITLTGVSTSYYFTLVGEYNVTLTVTDWFGLNDSDSITLDILEPPLDPVAEAGPNLTVPLGQEVELDGRGSTCGVALENWTWDFIDMVPRTLYGYYARYTFETTGDHLVTLTVRDLYWRSDTDTLTVRVTADNPNAPVAEAGKDTTIRVGTTYEFDGSGSLGDIPDLGFLWTFIYNGTHETMYGAGPAFTFSIAGEYLVTLTVTDTHGVHASDSVTITVSDKNPGLGRYAALIAFEGACAAAVVALIVYWLRLKAK